MRTTVHLAILCFTLSLSCEAQQVGYRDLTTSWRAPEDHIPSPPAEDCPNLKRRISEGETAVTPGENQAQPLQLTIIEIVPSRLRIGGDFTGTVRLKNTGTSAVRIPWQPDGEKAARVSEDGTEEKYEVADVNFRLGSAQKGAPLPLQSEGALFAYPDDPAAYIEIEPGHWVDIKMKGTVVCGLENCLGDVKADDHAILTAWWYQRILRHRVKDCTEDHGSYKVRQLDSAPFPVVVRPALESAKPGAKQ